MANRTTERAVEPRDHLIAPLGSFNADTDVVEVDVTSLVRRLVLFERFTVETTRFTEVPQLLELFGYDGLLKLLKTRTIRWKPVGGVVGELAGGGMLGPPEAPIRLPPEFFSFAIIRIHDAREQIHIDFENVGAVTELAGKKFIKLKNAIAECIVHEPTFEMPTLERESNGDLYIARLSIALAAMRLVGAEIDPTAFDLSFEKVRDDENKYRLPVFRSESNLSSTLGISDEVERDVLQKGLMGVEALNFRLGVMNAMNGVAGFRPSEQALFEAKFEQISAHSNPIEQERRFGRVISIGGLPEFNKETHSGIDAEKLIEIRSSPEAVKLRAWLRTTDTVPDDEIAAQLDDIGEKLSRLTSSVPGRVIRMLASEGIGAATGLGSIVSAPLSFVEDALVRRYIGSPGPISLLSHDYPSVLEGK